MTFDEMTKNLAVFLRDELKSIEGIHSLDFSINIDGRVHDGELKIEYLLGSAYSTGGQVKGGRLIDVLTEYKRRFGWDKRNAPLMISHDGGVKSDDDEIPF